MNTKPNFADVSAQVITSHHCDKSAAEDISASIDTGNEHGGRHIGGHRFVCSHNIEKINANVSFLGCWLRLTERQHSRPRILFRVAHDLIWELNKCQIRVRVYCMANIHFTGNAWLNSVDSQVILMIYLSAKITRIGKAISFLYRIQAAASMGSTATWRHENISGEASFRWQNVFIREYCFRHKARI